jgi:AraC-like DNA-binding protein
MAEAARAVPFDLFTTEGLPDRDRFEAWRQTASAVFEVAAAAPDDTPEPFNARMAIHHLGSLILMEVNFGAQRFVRTRRKIALDGLDHYQVQLYATGGLSGTAGDRDRFLGPGDIQILDLARTNITAARSSETIAFFVPRDLLDRALPSSNGLHGLVLRGASGPGGLLGDYMKAMMRRIPSFTVDEARFTAEACIGMVAASFRPTADGLARIGPQIEAAFLDRIKRHIDRQLGNPRFGPDTICNSCGVSRATLYRLFQPEGGVAKFIQDRRLARAFDDLAAPANRHLRIIDIAMRWGFSSEAHFSRAFRAAYGMSPKEARQGGFVGAAGVALGSVAGPTQSSLKDWLGQLQHRRPGG